MIQAIDSFEICSRVEQSNQPEEGLKRSLAPLNLALATNHMQANIAERRAQFEASGRIGKVLAYMLGHLDRPVHIAALGKIAGVSTSTFYALFKAAMGCTPNDFFTRARMHRACGLLQEKNLRIKEVAALLGYEDQFYFSRVFKSVSTVAPVHYRKLNLPMQQEIEDSLDPQQQTTACEKTLRQVDRVRFTVDGHSCRTFPAPQTKTAFSAIDAKKQIPVQIR